MGHGQKSIFAGMAAALGLAILINLLTLSVRAPDGIAGTVPHPVPVLDGGAFAPDCAAVSFFGAGQ